MMLMKRKGGSLSFAQMRKHLSANNAMSITAIPITRPVDKSPMVFELEPIKHLVLPERKAMPIIMGGVEPPVVIANKIRKEKDPLSFNTLKGVLPDNNLEEPMLGPIPFKAPAGGRPEYLYLRSHIIPIVVADINQLEREAKARLKNYNRNGFQ